MVHQPTRAPRARPRYGVYGHYLPSIQHPPRARCKQHAETSCERRARRRRSASWPLQRRKKRSREPRRRATWTRGCSSPPTSAAVPCVPKEDNLLQHARRRRYRYDVNDIFQQNFHGLRSEAALGELVSSAKRRNAFAIGGQETWRRGSEAWEQAGFTFVAAGPAQQCSRRDSQGVG